MGHRAIKDHTSTVLPRAVFCQGLLKHVKSA